MTLDLFLATGVENTHLRAVLSRFASGDWRKTGTFEYLATAGEKKVQVLKEMFTHFVPFLCAHAPRRFPSSRWTGANLALADLGLLAAAHGLLQSTYKVFMAQSFPVKASDGGAPEGGDDPVGNPFALAVPMEGDALLE